MASCARGTRIHGLAKGLVNNVVSVGGFSGYRIELCPDILKDRFFVAEILARPAVELPQDAVFSNREKKILAAGVHEDALEDDVEIQRFARSMLKVPFEVAVIGIDGNRRARIERIAFAAAC